MEECDHLEQSGVSTLLFSPYASFLPNRTPQPEVALQAGKVGFPPLLTGPTMTTRF